MQAIGLRRFIGVAEALQVLRPGSQWVVRENDYDKIEWYSDDMTLPSRAEVEAMIQHLEEQEPLRCLREIRDWYLQQTDWTQLSDIRAIRGPEWCSLWDTYRQELRDLTKTSTVSLGPNNEILGVIWPTKPSAK